MSEFEELTITTKIKLLTPSQVAEMLQVDVRTVSETWLRPTCTNGFPKPVMLSGRMKRWRLTDIENWLLERQL